MGKNLESKNKPLYLQSIDFLPWCEDNKMEIDTLLNKWG